MTFTSYLASSKGFHPTYKICIVLEDEAHNTNKDCSLHAALTLPPDILVDLYELRNYNAAFTFQLTNATDLESPVFGVEACDSELFLNLTLPGEIRHNLCIDFPIHVRYGRPLDYSEYQLVIIPCPRVFWSCPAADTQLSSSLTECGTSLRVPVGDTSSLGQVHLGTACVIFLIFWYCLQKTIATSRRMQLHPQKVAKVQ